MTGTGRPYQGVWESVRVDHPWIDITDAAALAQVLDLELPGDTKLLYSILTAALDRDQWTVVRTVDPSASTLPGTLGMQVLQTRVYFNVGEARKLWGDVAIFGAAFLVTQNTTLAAALTLLKKLKDTVKTLTTDEKELVAVIIGLARPDNPYATSVLEADVKSAYLDATVDVDTLLDALQRKNVIRTERVDKVRLVL